MHFPTALILSILPLGAFAAAIPQQDTDTTATIFTTSTGEERTIHHSAGVLSKRKKGGAPSFTAPKANGKIKKGPSFLYLPDPSDKCGDSTFHNKSTEGSPLVADCECLRDYFRTRDMNGLYSLSKWGFNLAPLASCGTCTFGAHTSNILGASVGNTDAADIIDESIRRFQHDGRVGAEGDMGCSALFETARTEWAIFV